MERDHFICIYGSTTRLSDVSGKKLPSLPEQLPSRNILGHTSRLSHLSGISVQARLPPADHARVLVRAAAVRPHLLQELLAEGAVR